MIDKQTQNISWFTSQLYSDDFYWNSGNNNVPKKKNYIFEFKFYVFLKYLLYETIFFAVVYVIFKYRYLNFVLFLLGWLFILNGFVWVVAIMILLLMLYESIEVRRIKKTWLYSRESSRIDKLL